jgi:RNA polymerase-interacting CarD/CdnL/TRCF family regulator
MNIEADIRKLVEGYKEVERLERVMSREQSQEARKASKEKKKALEEQVLSLGISLVSTVLADLHRIADGIATIAGPPATGGK